MREEQFQELMESIREAKEAKNVLEKIRLPERPGFVRVIRIRGEEAYIEYVPVEHMSSQEKFDEEDKYAAQGEAVGRS